MCDSCSQLLYNRETVHVICAQLSENSNLRVTRDLYRKCSGEESCSTFDKAVCSEPLAFAADAGLWGLNGRYALLRVWKRWGSVKVACETCHTSTSSRLLSR